MADGGEPMPYDVLRAVVKEPWQVMGAWRDGRMVGFTALAVRNEAKRSLNTWMTGVDRDLRGLGLATALKTKQALAVRDAGWRAIVTQNMEGNDAILASNRTLGFVPSVGLRDLSYDFA
jgi:predicted GNAT superfamily acetyltransferase